jgi:uncharacterized protein (TIGR02453 family)
MTPPKSAASSANPAFGPTAFEFYEGLEADNSKAYWDAHKAVYVNAIKEPMEALLSALTPEFGDWHMFRPHRDVRFSKDKRPYKESAGGYIEIEDGVGYYVQVSAEGVATGGGWWRSAPAQIARYRDAVAGPDGAELDKLVKALRKADYEIDGDVMKSAPRGFEADHARIELLKHRSLTMMTQYDADAWMETPELLKTVRGVWRKCRPTLEWLAQHVGPAEAPDA